MNQCRRQSLSRVMGITAAAAASLLAAAVCAAPRSWVGDSGEWHDVANWDGGESLPGPDDDVTITKTGASVTLTDSVSVGSLTLSKTLTFMNWSTGLNVARDAIIKKNGLMTCAGPFVNNAMSNRVSLVCSNLIIEQGGAIDVKGKGYAGATAPPNYVAGNGPGAVGGSGGGSHGGAGRIMSNLPGAFKSDTYDDPTAPIYPGSGGNSPYNSGTGGNGGGAVRISATQVVVNGTINADASVSSGAHWGGGSGGAIYIVCSTISGTNGTLSANGSGPATLNNYGGGGGGGCIAVLYETAAQTKQPVPALGFSVAPGIGNSILTAADIGTLYFPDSYLLSPTNFFTGQWLAPLTHTSFTPTDWCVADLMLSNAWIRLPCDGLRLTVTNTLTIISTDSNLGYLRNKLELTNVTAVTCGSCRIDAGALSLNFLVDPNIGVSRTDTAAANGVTMNCVGDLTLTNRSRLYLSAGLSCLGAADDYGAVVNVGGNARVGANSWIYPAAHPTNGAVVLFNTRNFTVDAGGGINANYLGYAHHYGSGLPADDSSWHYSSGAGYGGRGAPGWRTTTTWGPEYGSSNAPVAPGSGGRGPQEYPQTKGPAGGGSVQIRAQKTASIHGTITACGEDGLYAHGGAASGGGIYVTCGTFIGSSNGVLRANGGNGRVWSTPSVGGGGGGGGRIAVWRLYDKSDSVISNDVVGGTSYEPTSVNYADGERGTVVWGWLPPQGTTIFIR